MPTIDQERIQLIKEKLLLQKEIEEMKYVNARILEQIKEDFDDQLICYKKEQSELQHKTITKLKIQYQSQAEDMIKKIIVQYNQKASQLAEQHLTLEKQLEIQYEKELAILAQKKLTAETNLKHMHTELLECKRIISALRKKQLNYTVVF